MAVSSALLALESQPALLAEQAAQAAARLAQWHAYPSDMAKFQTSTISAASDRPQNLQFSSSSEATLAPYLDDLVKRLDMSQERVGRALDREPEAADGAGTPGTPEAADGAGTLGTPESADGAGTPGTPGGEEGAGGPTNPERSMIPGGATNGAEGAGMDPHEASRPSSPFATLSDVFTIGSEPSPSEASVASSIATPVSTESSIATSIAFGMNSGFGLASGGMRLLTATMTRSFGTHLTVSNHATGSGIMGSGEDSEADPGSSTSDNSEARCNAQSAMVGLAWAIAAAAVALATGALGVAFVVTFNWKRKQDSSCDPATRPEKRVSPLPLQNRGKLTMSM
jgi:hypothetical protein